MTEELGALVRILDDLGDRLDEVPRLAGRAVGEMGKDEYDRLAVALFGGDKKFSNSRYSRKARRAATARYNLFSDHVQITPTGDPWYIWAKGRGRHRIAPRRRSLEAVRTPWGPRRSVKGGRLEPRPERLEPAADAIAKKAPALIADEVAKAIGKAL